MFNYVVKVRAADGTVDYYECHANSEAEAVRKVSWAFIREGVVIDVWQE